MTIYTERRARIGLNYLAALAFFIALAFVPEGGFWSGMFTTAFGIHLGVAYTLLQGRE